MTHVQSQNPSNPIMSILDEPQKMSLTISPLFLNMVRVAYHSRKMQTCKIIRIKNFRWHPVYDQTFLDAELIKLNKNLNVLLQNEDPDVSLEELYRTVEHLLELNKREAIFDILIDNIKRFLSKKLEEMLVVAAQAEIFYDNIISVWYYYCKKVTILKNIYLRFDRPTQRDLNFNTIQSICMDLFKNIIILNDTISDLITKEVLNAISRERFGLFIDRDAIDTILSVLLNLKVYELLFEKPFLAVSARYYENESANITKGKMDVGSYLRYVTRKIEQEISRNYICNESIVNVLSIIYREMIESHLKEILNQGFEQMMDDNNILTLKLLYKLFNKVPNGVKLIADYFQKYVDKLCQVIVNNGVDKQMIQELMDLKQRLDNIIIECFQQNGAFYDIVKAIYDKAINTKNTESALYLAKYLDNKLKSKNVSEEELKTILDKVMVIFRFIQGKDIFEAFYRKDLAKRLIFDKSTNQDIEQSIVVKLKQECGEGFTSKIEGMLTDMHLSKTINGNFKEFLANTQPNLLEKSEISISVLTSSFWTKSVTNLTINAPDELLNYQAVFSKYYISIHTGRKLDWQPNLAYCVLRANYINHTKELLVSLFQAIVLLLFNEHNKLNSLEIQEQTKLETKDLIATLHSLACVKFRILTKEPQNNTVSMNDCFKFNADFTDKLFRIKINQAQLKESGEELKATEKNVLADRQFQIDAAIVRILKSKKVVKHNELLAELFKILDIPIRPQDLKKRIELLIDREYIKRDFDNAATYTYIA